MEHGNPPGLCCVYSDVVFLAGLFKIRKCRAPAQIKPAPLSVCSSYPGRPPVAFVAVLPDVFLMARWGCY